MYDVLKEIDLFIIKNLLRISNDGYLKYLSFEQLINFIQHKDMCLKEIDLFNLVWKWIKETKLNNADLMHELFKNIRFSLISPNDLVDKIQIIDEIMTDSYCRELILLALNYHVLPFSQSVQKKINNNIRSPVTSIICVGGRELNPQPCLRDQCYLMSSFNAKKIFLFL